ncbi:GvpL/GvpF family gas vesicle protein [Streptomyces sp. NPDC057695]|uniref:GvpL/GvpF family gas vesicle protein n=1 Tax=Streptomyces sp. NPDC057695 TaxID=3346217 RepID=UPI00369D7779
MALYVYAITAADHPLDLDGLSGVGSEPAPVRAVASGPLCAVVSDVSETIRPKRRDLTVHNEVQEHLMRDGTLLPLQFGYTAPDESTVEQVLQKDAEGFLANLERLGGCAEYHVRASQDEEVLLRRILAEDADARALDARLRDGDTDPRLPLALGEMIATQVQAREEALASGLIEALVPFAREHAVRQASEPDFLNFSLLVPDDRREEFLTAEAQLAREIGEGVEFRLNGPLPPYSFVE